jgi:hypothetical protein
VNASAATTYPQHQDWLQWDRGIKQCMQFDEQSSRVSQYLYSRVTEENNSCIHSVTSGSSITNGAPDDNRRLSEYQIAIRQHLEIFRGQARRCQVECSPGAGDVSSKAKSAPDASLLKPEAARGVRAAGGPSFELRVAYAKPPNIWHTHSSLSDGCSCRSIRMKRLGLSCVSILKRQWR